MIQNLILNTVMSVDHFIDGFLGLTDYRRLKIGQMFPLKIFFLWVWAFFFFFKVLSLLQYYFCCFCSGVTFGHERCMTLAPQPVTETAPCLGKWSLTFTSKVLKLINFHFNRTFDHNFLWIKMWWNMHQRIYWKLFWLVKKKCVKHTG